MKTLEQIKTMYVSKTIDGRDISRLLMFIPNNQLSSWGIKLDKDELKEERQIIPFTRENIIKQLEEDVDFGFSKALNRRGISSWLMYEVVKMWNWVLEEGLEGFDTYEMYGLPVFKATALKYGFYNPIGEDSGSENKYNEQEDNY